MSKVGAGTPGRMTIQNDFRLNLGKTKATTYSVGRIVSTRGENLPRRRYTRRMSGLVLLLLLVGLLTLVGSAALFFVTYKYYWGERGTPPLTGAERRLQNEAELQRRAKQIARARKNPVTPRSPDFWDNRKRP